MNTNAEALLRQLPDIGDGLAGAVQTLVRDPAPDKCELLAIRLDGVRRHVLTLGNELIRGANDHGE